jgi:hypothetical protein
MKEASNHLVVLWSSQDREVALKMAFMYTFNAKRHGWWDRVTLIVWGPSAKLIVEDDELQEHVRMMQETGVRFEACKSCADMYGSSDRLEELGIDVKYMGVPLTTYLKEGSSVITF